MKHRIKNFVSLIIAASMLLSLIPLTSAALDDEFAGFETLEEVPFEFELEPGDLPWEQLGTATLAASDIPACISPALAEARGHVNRLYQQEPDDYTVMFQNRDGSKTIYVFSYPVKSTGMSMNTAATIQVNGSAISFASGNIITSRIGVDLFDYNIGYCEVQTFFGGLLTADGVNITEDARGWARSESSAGNLVYNMSGSAAAEYNMNISATSTATLVPGITITPIDPTPAGGITVMAITYSELAGLMSFKNVQTNQYLSLTTSATSLTTSSTIVNPYSSWYVQYDSEIGYYLSNLSDVYNTYLSFSGTNVLFLNSEPDVESGFTLSLISQSDDTVTIDCYEKAINSNGTIYVASGLNYDFPTSCQWKIVNKRNAVLATRVSAVSSTRIEQSGVGFYLDYTVLPANASMFEVALYYADTNTEVTHDTETSDGDEYEYYINTPGIYTVYYKDSVTGVRSANFTLIIVESLTTYAPKDTYSITQAIIPNGSNPLYLTRNASGELVLKGKNLTSTTVTRRGGVSGTIMYEDIQNFSRTFTFDYEDDSLGMDAGVCLTATRSTSQYTGMPQGSLINTPLGRPIPDYTITYTDNNGYTVNYASNDYDLEEKSSDTPFWVCDMGSYYLIISDIFYDNNGDIVIMALKSNGADQEVTVSELTDSDDFKWNVFFVGIDVPVIKQTHKLWCGPTSFLQVLYGADLQLSVPGNTLNEQQQHIRTKLYNYTYTNDATYMEYYATDINNSGFLSSEYICTEIANTSTKTQDQIREYITSSLQDGMACIFFTVTGNSTTSENGPYKNGYNWDNPTDPSGHLECIIGYDPLTDTVIINNCHYMENRIGLGEIRLSDLCADMERLWYFEDANN